MAVFFVHKRIMFWQKVIGMTYCHVILITFLSKHQTKKNYGNNQNINTIYAVMNKHRGRCSVLGFNPCHL